MKALLAYVFIFIAGSLLATSDTISDTIEKHSFKQIDDHLVIIDTVIIEHKINDVKTNTKIVDRRNYWLEIVVFCLIAMSFINHYFKRKNNG